MNFSRTEKLFIFFSMISAFFICGEYAITRPTSNALFLSLFSSQAYPWVWLFTVPLNLFAVFLYNRFLPKIGPLKMLYIIAIATIFINGLCAIYPQKSLVFFQYAWKDIYILFMLKQLWSMIHSSIATNRAKYLYGFIYGVGTLGAVLASLIPSFLATHFGSENILLFTTPVYGCLLLCYTQAFARSKLSLDTFEKDLTFDPRAREAVSLIRRTPILMAVLLLVVFMQISAALMEYQFNLHLEQNILDKDLRTAFCGKIIGAINVLSLSLQFLGGFLMVRTLGLKGSHFLIPILLFGSAFVSMTIPTFAMIAFSFVFLKAVDFSLFGVIREMLYIPLQLDAKFRAKAIIDVFAYRTSKALVSLGLLVLQAVAMTVPTKAISYFSLTVFVLWIFTVAIFFKKQKRLEKLS